MFMKKINNIIIISIYKKFSKKKINNKKIVIY